MLLYLTLSLQSAVKLVPSPFLVINLDLTFYLFAFSALLCFACLYQLQ